MPIRESGATYHDRLTTHSRILGRPSIVDFLTGQILPRHLADAVAGRLSLHVYLDIHFRRLNQKSERLRILDLRNPNPDRRNRMSTGPDRIPQNLLIAGFQINIPSLSPA